MQSNITTIVTNVLIFVFITLLKRDQVLITSNLFNSLNMSKTNKGDFVLMRFILTFLVTLLSPFVFASNSSEIVLSSSQWGGVSSVATFDLKGNFKSQLADYKRGGDAPSSVIVSSSGSVFVSLDGVDRIDEIINGSRTVFFNHSAVMGKIGPMAMDVFQNIYLVRNNVVEAVSPFGLRITNNAGPYIPTVLGNCVLNRPSAIYVAGDKLFAINEGSSELLTYTINTRNSPLCTSSRVLQFRPTAMTVAEDGMIYYFSSSEKSLFRVNKFGVQQLVFNYKSPTAIVNSLHFLDESTLLLGVHNMGRVDSLDLKSGKLTEGFIHHSLSLGVNSITSR